MVKIGEEQDGLMNDELGVYLPFNSQNIQGLYPFSETNFQDFSRTQIDFSRTLKFTLTRSLPRS